MFSVCQIECTLEKKMDKCSTHPPTLQSRVTLLGVHFKL
uniref:Uncharacterized protein n=1 Tax=Rhizophora mucronata TaxID=61149 RepID=A0A2P2P2M3_RHIMU